MKPAFRLPAVLSLAMAFSSLLCQQTDAAVVTYTNRAVWSNTVKDNVLDTFSNLTGTTQGSTVNRPGYSVSATTVANIPTALRTGNSQTPAVATRPFLTANTQFATTFTLNFAAPRTAFGLDAFVTTINLFNLNAARNISTGSISVTVNGQTLSRSTTGPTFFGFTSDTPFSQVTITKTGAANLAFNALSIENVELATAVPEPSSIATTGLLAMAAVAAARRRRTAREKTAAAAAAV